MTLIGPRPQLVRDIVFMSKEQRRRHTAKPGLSGLAQVNGRNAITWEEKINWDLKYVQKVSLAGDIRILLKTVKTAFIKQEGITDGDMATAEDFGDYLLNTGKIEKNEYMSKQVQARKIINNNVDERILEDDLVSIIMPSYNASLYIEEAIKSVVKQTYLNWEL